MNTVNESQNYRNFLTLDLLSSQGKQCFMKTISRQTDTGICNKYHFRWWMWGLWQMLIWLAK